VCRALERLEEAGSRLADASVDEVCNGLVAALGVEATRDDDVAVLAVRLDAVAGPGFHRVFPAGSEQLRELRTAMRVWLDSRGVSVATTNAALLAVGEACANAIEHAYMDGNEGDVAVDITQSHDGSLLVLVRDTGRFRAAPAPGGDRGRGTDIMRALTTDFSRDSTGSGTTVRFRVPVEEPAAA
jgi:anti-sigma regulatory factor (Ser/Thr protein kinase)